MKLTKFLGAVILAVSVTAAAAFPVSADTHTVTAIEKTADIEVLKAAGFEFTGVTQNTDGTIKLPTSGTNSADVASKFIKFTPTYKGTLTVNLKTSTTSVRAGILQYNISSTNSKTGVTTNYTNQQLGAFSGGTESTKNTSYTDVYLELDANKPYYIATKGSTNTFATISSITYTYAGEDKAIAVDPITVDGNTTSAGIKFTRSDTNNIWDYSVYEQVNNFVGTVNFDVTMSDVPTGVTVTGESYAE